MILLKARINEDAELFLPGDEGGDNEGDKMDLN